MGGYYISLRNGNALGLFIVHPCGHLYYISLRNGNALGHDVEFTAANTNYISLRNGNALGLGQEQIPVDLYYISLRNGNALGLVSTARRQPPIAETICAMRYVANLVSSGMSVNRLDGLWVLIFWETCPWD